MKHIRYLTLLLGLMIFCCAPGRAENYRITNIRLNIADNQLIVNYDLLSKRHFDPVQVRLLFYDIQYRIYVPKSVTPGSREPIKPGINRSVMWAFSQDMRKIDVELHPYLIAGDISSHNFRHGPEAALFSLMVPGLGNYFVSDTRSQTIKPWMKTIGALGLIALGTYAANERYRDDPSLYGPNDKKWKEGDWHYKFFSSDAEIIIGLGAAIWVADIILVAIQGQHNKKLETKILGMSMVYR